MGKLGLAAIGIAAVALYLLIGEDEAIAPEPADAPPVTQQRSRGPVPTAPSPASRLPDGAVPEWGQNRYLGPESGYGTQRPGGYPPTGGYAPSNGYGYAPGSGYPSTGPALAPGYQFRPLTPSEKQRMEQQYPGGYAAALDPYGLSPRGGQGLAGIPGSGHGIPQQGISPGYSVSPNADPYAPPPASGAYAPGAGGPYEVPGQSSPGYGADDWPRPSVRSYGGNSPYSVQPPAPGYGFRPLDSGRADPRWHDTYSTPPAYPQHQRRPSGNSRSPNWRPTAPGQRGTSADAGPLWAAREYWN